jgi:hypothetical protein
MSDTLKRSAAICALFLSMSCAAFAAQSEGGADPSVGTWKINLEKSQFSGARPQMEVRRYWMRADGFVVGLAISVDAAGNPNFVQFAARNDGREYPEYNVATLADLQAAGTNTPVTYAQKSVNSQTVDVTLKRDGRVTTTGSRSVSPDGKTMTIILNTTTPQGQTVTTVRTFDRQ